MGRFKRITILALFFLFVGGSFSSGLIFKKKKVVEDVIEYEDIVTRVTKVKRRLPASASKEPIVNDRPQKVEPTRVVIPQTHVTYNEPSQDDDHYQDIGDSSSHSSYMPSAPLNVVSAGREFASDYSYSGGGSSSGSSSSSPSSNTTSTTGNSLTAGGGFFVGNVTQPSPNTETDNQNNSENTENRKPTFKVHSIAIKNGELILTGENLSAVKKIQIEGQSLEKLSSTSSRLVAMGVSSVKLAMGQIYKLIVSDAHASSTFPIEFELRDGSVGPRKLAPLGSAEDGFVLKWDAIGRTWVAAPDEVGEGPDGGILSITRGVGLKDRGTEITTSGLIAVDVGTNAGQIPQFSENDKLYFESYNALVFANEEDDEFSFGITEDGDFEFKKQVADGPEFSLFRVEGDEITINGKSICFSDGENCLKTGGDYVSNITVQPPLIAGGTKENTELSIGLDGSTIVLNDNKLALGSLGATNGQVIKWVDGKWAAANDLNTTVEVPSVREFALKGQVFIPCATNETLRYDSDTDNFVCGEIILEDSDIRDVAIENSLEPGATDIAPSQNAVKNALAEKQDKITSKTELQVKSLILTNLNSIGVELQAPPGLLFPLAEPFTLPDELGVDGQVLTAKGSGVMKWETPKAETLTGIEVIAPLAKATAGSVTTLSLEELVNSHIKADAAIEWSKIDSTGKVTNDDLAGSIAISKLEGSITSAEFGHLSGIAENIQEQLNRKSEWEPDSNGTLLEYIDGTGENRVLDTSVVPENGRLYFTEERVLATLLDEYEPGTNAVLLETDSIFAAFGKLDGAVAGLSGKGQWEKDGATTLYYTAGNVGVGTQVANERLTLEGVLSLREVAAPNATTDYGKLYTMSDGKLYFKNSAGTAIALGSSDTVTSTQIVDGTIVNADISATAGIDASKIGGGTVSTAEFNFLAGLDANIQGQINATNSSVASHATAISALQSSQWDKNGSDLYYNGGNVGIGTATPQTSLQIASGPILIGANIGGYSTNGIIVNSPSSRSDITFMHSGTGNTQTGDGLNIAQVFERAEFNLRENGDMVFKTNDTEALRIKNTGNIGIGTTTPSEKLEVAGNIKATEFLYTSDERLKHDIKTLSRAIDKVLRLRGVEFKWNENNQKTMGFIAQEVEKVLPELVKTDEYSNLKSVQYGNLVGLLVEALKEEHQSRLKVERKLSSTIDEMQVGMKRLEEENRDLKERLEKIEKYINEKH